MNFRYKTGGDGNAAQEINPILLKAIGKSFRGIVLLTKLMSCISISKTSLK